MTMTVPHPITIALILLFTASGVLLLLLGGPDNRDPAMLLIGAATTLPIPPGTKAPKAKP